MNQRNSVSRYPERRFQGHTLRFLIQNNSPQGPDSEHLKFLTFYYGIKFRAIFCSRVLNFGNSLKSRKLVLAKISKNKVHNDMSVLCVVHSTYLVIANEHSSESLREGNHLVPVVTLALLSQLLTLPPASHMTVTIELPQN